MYLIDTNIISELTKPKQNFCMTLADSLIAATAIHHNRILVTRNVSDFKKCGLSLLNPFEMIES